MLRGSDSIASLLSSLSSSCSAVSSIRSPSPSLISDACASDSLASVASDLPPKKTRRSRRQTTRYNVAEHSPTMQSSPSCTSSSSGSPDLTVPSLLKQSMRVANAAASSSETAGSQHKNLKKSKNLPCTTTISPSITVSPVSSPASSPSSSSSSSSRASSSSSSTASASSKASSTTSSSKTAKVCAFCQTDTTPMWRRGPDGKGTLCNACGVRWSVRRKKNGDAPPSRRRSVDSVASLSTHEPHHKSSAKRKKCTTLSDKQKGTAKKTNKRPMVSTSAAAAAATTQALNSDDEVCGYVELEADDVTHGEHPLSTSEHSIWKTYFQDEAMLREIQKDVCRTFPHLHFFNHDPEKDIGHSEHSQALRRILFIYAKLNPGIAYVQGMNEILGPIYYVFASDQTELFAGHAEADAFFAFTQVMSEIMNNFCETLDHSSLGIKAQLNALNQLLKRHDFELWNDLEQKGIDPQFYSFRWLTLLLSQEFELPDVLRLWDSLFADPKRYQFLQYVCIAMITRIRHQIIGRSFADNLKLLQHYPLTDIREILQSAVQLHHPFSPASPSVSAPQQRIPSARQQSRSQSQQRRQASAAPSTSSSESSSPFEFAFETLKRALS
mmetsp:Transcript_2875/g.9033  ORF Transcript_2875/g.9033 Transcript_2875/m.9033 type:complete len:611 (+) Transcript_2875:143-1975(+)